ncbi:MAG: hypothetical protein AB1545_12145 [Thermodesulfobacteriota bacterium]
MKLNYFNMLLDIFPLGKYSVILQEAQGKGKTKGVEPDWLFFHPHHHEGCLCHGHD